MLWTEPSGRFWREPRRPECAGGADRIEDCTGSWTRGHSEALREAEFRGESLSDGADKVLRQPSTQVMAWSLLVALSQVGNENWERKT
jgi:hypothetical protein